MSSLVVFESGDQPVQVRLEGETVWLSLQQLAELFQRDKSVISRHLRNIYATQELNREATVAKNATVQMEGGREVQREIEFYNLDAIISVGYRVNSAQATRFRQWATSMLRQHLVEGYTLNQQRLQERGIEFEQALASIEQGFGDELFSPNVASRAAHLLYFVIKNHPLADGNKRTGSFLFLWYLRLNQHLLARPVEQLINDNTLVALALLVAESKPDQKALMVKLLEHFVLLDEHKQ